MEDLVVLGVEEVDGLEDLREDLPDGVLLDAPVLLAEPADEHGQVSLLAVLHDDLEVLLLLVDDVVVLLADVGVFDALHDVEFVEHLLLLAFVHLALEDFLLDLDLLVDFGLHFPDFSK